MMLVFADEGACRRQPLFDLQALLRKDNRRMREPAVFKAWRARQLVEAGDDALAIILRRKGAGRVAGADAQLQHHRRVACLGKFESLLDHANDRRKIGPRIEQPHRGFQRIGIRTFLNNAGAFTVVFAENDHGAADNAGRSQI